MLITGSSWPRAARTARYGPRRAYAAHTMVVRGHHGPSASTGSVRAMAAQTHRTAAHPARLTVRELNRATLERQLLLRRSAMSAREAVGHLVGLQAQNTKPPYFQLYARLADFDPAELSALMESREVVRLVTLRSTLHTHTADDALTLGPLVRAPRDRELASFRHGLEGVDLGSSRR